MTDDLVDLWARSDHVVVLTGAGISTDSGIPDFRGPDGVVTRDPNAATMYDIDSYVNNPAVRRRAWQSRKHHPALTAQPNRGHLALTRLQGAGRLGTVITQNIDGLHQRAGSQDVLELHGTMWEIVCLSCGDRTPTREVIARDEDDPPCLKCGGILKTATVSFGQSLDPDVIRAAFDAAEAADLLVAIGTSLTVTPAAFLANASRHLAVVNAQDTDYDGQADVVVRDPISDVLSDVAGQLA